MKFSEMSPTTVLSREIWFPVIEPGVDGESTMVNKRLSSTAFFDIFGKGSHVPFISFKADTNTPIESIPNYNNDGATGVDAIAIGMNSVALETDTVVVGNHVEGDRERTIFLGNAAYSRFNTPTRDYRFYNLNDSRQYSFITGELAYLLTPNAEPADLRELAPANLVLPYKTRITSVGDGADNDDAVTIGQLKRTISVLCNDYALYGKASVFAAFSVSMREMNYGITWYVTSMKGEIYDLKTLKTLDEKKQWIMANFDVLKTIPNPSPGVAEVWLLIHTTPVDIEIRYAAESPDGFDLELENLPIVELLHGGYDALENMSLIGGNAPLSPPPGWDYNHSLHPVRSDVFYVLAGLPNLEISCDGATNHAGMHNEIAGRPVETIKQMPTFDIYVNDSLVQADVEVYLLQNTWYVSDSVLAEHARVNNYQVYGDSSGNEYFSNTGGDFLRFKIVPKRDAQFVDGGYSLAKNMFGDIQSGNPTFNKNPDNGTITFCLSPVN